ncbi:MAG TPA: hypothetical protein VFV42_12370 [Acidimicrobiales bacterium]|nr:hypothetical protein [Acidimicrobiales bacterium]
MAAVTAVATPLPLDRVLWVRLEIDESGLVGGVVSGVRRRRPATVHVGPRVAFELVEAGVPSVTRHVGAPS